MRALSAPRERFRSGVLADKVATDITRRGSWGIGIQIGLRGQGNYAATVESVKQQSADHADAPDYQALRDYIFAGAGTGTLRVKYGNHNQQLELGTKGMFARGERHELTAKVLEQAVARQYGARAADQFVTAVRVSTTQGDVYKLDKASVRKALYEVEIAFGQGAAALKHPDVLKIPPDSATALAADIKKNWDLGGAIPGKPGAPAGSEPPGLFPAPCITDIQRYHATWDNGQLTVERGGGGAADPDQYFKDESEKYIAFFELGFGVSRDAPEFKNMFRNVIRNFNQNFELTLNNKVMDHAMSVGYQSHTFVPDGNSDAPMVQKLKFEDGQLVFDRSHSLAVSLIQENLQLMATMTENFRLPVEALKTDESQFDISQVAVGPTRSYAMKQIT